MDRRNFRIYAPTLAEAAAAAGEAAKNAAEIAAGSLLFRLYPPVEDAEGATIDASASYLAIAEFSPQPRFYERFASDPGSGDRFQSADGGWWQGLPLPPTALDFANAVARSANATLGAGDMDQVHIWANITITGSSTAFSLVIPRKGFYTLNFTAGLS
ncbi:MULTISPECIES: hypothetical protein [unclassified Sinorhizobium]|uniref:hypothetical protein n=1 Tax=unclassified Sinorhizobium TaxID=2613772 RepID=UPI003524CE54